MNLTVEIPDDLVGRLNAAGGDLSRRALVALALEEYKSGHITKAEMPRVLGLLLIDNREGVMAARRRGFRVTGILGVLSMAARRDPYRRRSWISSPAKAPVEDRIAADALVDALPRSQLYPAIDRASTLRQFGTRRGHSAPILHTLSWHFLVMPVTGH
jgi:hypothetical protein